MENKYPRTFHLPISLGISSDDKVQHDLSYYDDKKYIVLEKMDGENTSMNKDRVWARSIDSPNTEWRTWVRRIWSEINYRIPDNFTICGENLYAQHSIFYDNLSDYFQVFSVWDGDICLSWDDTVSFCKDLNLITVRKIQCKYENFKDFYSNFYNFLIDENFNPEKMEGIVVRPEDTFLREDFSKCVLKYVRSKHIKTDRHWTTQKIVTNKLRGI